MAEAEAEPAVGGEPGAPSDAPPDAQGSPGTPGTRSHPVSPANTYSSALEALKAIPEPDLSVLSPARKPRQKPGQWDGRVTGLSLREYRALKWGVEAGHKMCNRGGPQYSIRGKCMTRSNSGPESLLDNDVVKSWNTTQPSVASYSVGRLPIVQPPERTPGPSHYVQRSILGSSSHPTLSKDLGRQFGRERLLVNDEAMPAPGDYDVSGFEQAGRFKKSATPVIQGREAWADPPVAPGPAPGDYNFDEIFRNGKHTGSRLTIQGKSEMTQPPIGAAATRLRKRLDVIRRGHQFEKDIDFGRISPILLALEAPQLMEICKKLQDNASLIRDPNTFLVAAAMKKLGNSGGYGARKPVHPGPTHYRCPGAGGLEYAHRDKPPEWSFNREHRGLVT